jgi:hypothetical protein
MAKYVLIGAAVLSLLAAGLGFVTKGKIGALKDSVTAAQDDSKRKDEQVAAATKEKKAAVDEATQAKEALQTAQTAADDAKKQAADASHKVEEATTQIDTLNNQIKQLQASAGTGTNPTGDSDKDQKIADLTKQVEDLKKSNQELDTVAKSATEQIKNAESATESLRKAEDNRRRGVAAYGREGEILAVNPAYGFVVLNLGDRSGITVNAPLVVKRGGSMIAKLRVSSVEPATSVADVVPGSMAKGAYIRPGDSVVVTRPERPAPGDSDALLPSGA